MSVLFYNVTFHDSNVASHRPLNIRSTTSPQHLFASKPNNGYSTTSVNKSQLALVNNRFHLSRAGYHGVKSTMMCWDEKNR